MKLLKIKPSNRLDDKRFEVACNIYNKRYDDRLYREACQGIERRYLLAHELTLLRGQLIDCALEICGSPYHAGAMDILKTNMVFIGFQAWRFLDAFKDKRKRVGFVKISYTRFSPAKIHIVRKYANDSYAAARTYTMNYERSRRLERVFRSETFDHRIYTLSNAGIVVKITRK